MTAQAPRSPLCDKRLDWINRLEGDDENSIVRQIYRMTWDAAAFRVINKARTLAPSARDKTVQISGLLHGLLNRSFLTSQMSAIRRLVESDRRVYSLIHLLQCISGNARLLTRANMFAAENLPYHFEDLKIAEREYCDKQCASGRHGFMIPRELYWRRYEYRHRDIDMLTGTQPSERSPDDAIPVRILNNLSDRLKDACSGIENHVNKHVAHAASSEERQKLDPVRDRITLGKIWKAHATLAQVAGFVSLYVLGGSEHQFLPTPQFDAFRYIDIPLISSEQVPDLRQVWEQFEQETTSWASWIPEDLQKEGQDEAF